MTERALVLVDLQRALVAMVWDGDTLVARLAAVADSARAAGAPVIYLQQDGIAGSGFETNTDAWRIHEHISPRPTDVVIHKPATDGFFKTDLEELLRRRGIDTIVLGGVASGFCIDATTRSAQSHGFNVDLLLDGHSTRADHGGGLTPEQIITHHNEILSRGIHRGGHVRLLSCSDAIFDSGPAPELA